VRPPTAFRRHTLVSDCAASTMAAMTRAGVSRFVLVSVAVLFPLPGLKYAFFRWMLQHIARDLAAAETVVRAAPLDWTIARPPRLVNGADLRYAKQVDGLPNHGRTMTFRGVAAFMLDAVGEGAHRRQVVGLAAG
jgi:uncharacterized protein YbjT (DUF2867 family)